VATALKKYSETFYDETRLTSTRSARVIVPLILNLTGAKSVCDLGCGTGSWLSVFKDCGVETILGVDNSSIDNGLLQIAPNEIQRHDLTKPFTLDRQFDLASCLEVAEHLPHECAPQIIENLTSLSPMVLFSAAIPHQGGTNHINEQWPEYWAKLFASRGYRAIDCVREAIWQNEDVAYWYAQNLILYVREDLLRFHPHLQELAKRTNPQQLTFIHPKTYVKNYYASTDPRVLLMRFLWNATPRSIRMLLIKPLKGMFWKQVSTTYR
jgi:hypothetical protein